MSPRRHPREPRTTSVAFYFCALDLLLYTTSALVLAVGGRGLEYVSDKRMTQHVCRILITDFLTLPSRGCICQ